MVSYTFNDLDIIQSNNNIDYFKVLVHLLGKITVIAEMSLIFLWKNDKKKNGFIRSKVTRYSDIVGI